MSYIINLATHKRYNMHHTHHKREPFMTKLRGLFKLWRYRGSVHKKCKNNQYSTNFTAHTYKKFD